MPIDYNRFNYNLEPYNDWMTATPVTTNTYTADATGTVVHRILNHYVTDDDLDKFAHKIYQIITEHAKIDISEEEFMRILQEGD